LAMQMFTGLNDVKVLPESALAEIGHWV
jgi:hypothetical protein